MNTEQSIHLDLGVSYVIGNSYVDLECLKHATFVTPTLLHRLGNLRSRSLGYPIEINLADTIAPFCQ